LFPCPNMPQPVRQAHARTAAKAAVIFFLLFIIFPSQSDSSFLFRTFRLSWIEEKCNLPASFHQLASALKTAPHRIFRPFPLFQCTQKRVIYAFLGVFPVLQNTIGNGTADFSVFALQLCHSFFRPLE